MRKTARSSREAGRDNHFSCNLRLADMYLGYAEVLSAWATSPEPWIT